MGSTYTPKPQAGQEYSEVAYLRYNAIQGTKSGEQGTTLVSPSSRFI